jgi:hypothetical protein
MKIMIDVPINTESKDIPELEYCPSCKEEGTLERRFTPIPHTGEKGKGRWGKI